MLRTTTWYYGTTPYIYGIPGRKLHADGSSQLFDGRRGAPSQNCFYSELSMAAIPSLPLAGKHIPPGKRLTVHGPRPLWGWDNNNKTLLLIPRTDIHTAESLDSALGPFVHRWGLGRMRNSPTCQFCQTAAAGSMGS